MYIGRQSLLWFHHVPWDYKMKSGSTLWQELCMKYNIGVAMVEVYRDFWHTSAKPRSTALAFSIWAWV